MNLRLFVIIYFFYYITVNAEVPGFMYGTHLTHATSREDHGFVYLNESGEPEDPYVTWARLGGNFVMMDHFVSCGYYGLNDIVRQSMRAEKAGLMIGINFHYSQHYGPDTIPYGWPQTYEGLKDKIYQYTDSVLTVLADSGVTVDLVKVGNELDWAEDENGKDGETGLLFPIGDYSGGNITEFMGLIREGCRAVRDFDSTILVALHLIDLNANSSANLFSEMADSGISFDICAKSWYSKGGNHVNKVTDHFTKIINTTGKSVMITECGFPWTSTNFGPPNNKGQRGSGDEHYDLSEEGAKLYYQDLIKLMATLPNNKGVGVVTWPGAYTYNAAAETPIPDGCDTAFMKDPNSNGTNTLSRSTWDSSCFWHSETGQVVKSVMSAFMPCSVNGIEFIEFSRTNTRSLIGSNR